MGQLGYKGRPKSRVKRGSLLCACAAMALVHSPAVADPGGNGNGNAFGLNGGGYSTFSQKATVGLAIEKPRFLLSVSTGYDLSLIHI